MSRSYVNQVTSSSPLKGAARTIHIILADHADDLGMCWPKQETLAEKAACSVRYVKKVIKQLVELGWLEVLQKPGAKARANAYRLNPKGNSSSLSKGNYRSPSKGNYRSPSYIEEEPIEEPVEPQKNSAPMARRKEDPVHVGELPPDDERPAAPSKHTFKSCVSYFQQEARAARAQGDVARIRRVVKEMHQDGLSYDQIQALFRKFFVKDRATIRSRRNEYPAIALFQQMKQRYVNQGATLTGARDKGDEDMERNRAEVDAWMRERYA
jgi:DNA-binding transcriptional regulator YhcF (GntR family)